MKRFFALIFLSAFISGCGDHSASDSQNNLSAAPNSSSVPNDPATAMANQTASAPPLTDADMPDLPEIAGDIVYDCTPNMTVSTRFVAQQQSSEESAGSDDMIVMVNGTAHRMELVRSGSGAKYQAADGLIWWNKGLEGTLYQTRNGEEQVVATCREKP